MKKILFAFIALTSFLFAQNPSRNIALQWDSPETNNAHGVFIYSANGHVTNYPSFTKILTVFGGTNTSCVISNLPYGVYSMYCTAFATNQFTTNIIESNPSNFVFFSHTPSVISD